MHYKPRGYTDLAPYLMMEQAKRTIAFLEAVFDAERLRMIEAEDGRLRHGEVRIGDSVLMLAEAVAGWPPVPAHVHIYVPDVDATWQRALAAGATEVQAPKQADDEDRRGGFRDAGGATWWIATEVGRA